MSILSSTDARPLMQQTFKQNSLLTMEYETLPLSSPMPGYTGFQPGKANGVVGQRGAAASLHTVRQRMKCQAPLPVLAAAMGIGLSFRDR